MTEKKPIPSLYGLRAISVLLVVVYHLQNARDPISFPSFIEPSYFGHFGVNIFFVISGFIITTLLMNEAGQNGHISIPRFYVRRILRIFPAYYFLLLTYFILQLTSVIHLENTDWFFSLTLLKQFSNPGGITGHLWTISAEEVFYLFFPIIFIWLYPKNKRLLNYLLIFVTLAAVPASRMLIHNVFPTYPFNVFVRGDALAIGCLLALNYDKIRIIGRYYKTIFMALILMELSYLMLQETTYPEAAQILLGSAGWSLPDNLAIAIILIVSIEQRSSLWFRFLNSKVLVFIGTISYSIYLWQQIFTSQLELGIFNKLPYSLIFLFLASVLSYKLIEKPFLDMRKRFKY
jgi:peptidoglycan/LPS O-acetylase OafA/YrhL